MSATATEAPAVVEAPASADAQRRILGRLVTARAELDEAYALLRVTEGWTHTSERITEEAMRNTQILIDIARRLLAKAERRSWPAQSERR